MIVQKKVDPSLQVDIRPVYNRRLKDERDRKQQDEMKRRYIEDKWRYAVFDLLLEHLIHSENFSCFIHNLLIVN